MTTLEAILRDPRAAAEVFDTWRDEIDQESVLIIKALCAFADEQEEG